MHFVNAKGILSAQNGMNLYRGCTHGCIYCDARSTCYQIIANRTENKTDAMSSLTINNSIDLFEDVEVKQNAPELLEQTLLHKRNRCMIGTGGMSDPYQHCEKDLLLTRRCLELIDKYRFGLAIQTKSDMILRDLDLLRSINKKAKCVVQLTLTTADDDLCRIVEPHVCVTSRRIEVLKIMQSEGIPTVVWITPLLPHITGTVKNVRALMNSCISCGVHGIILFGAGLTLRDGDRQYYYKKLDEHFPGMKEKYMREFGDAYELACEESGAIVRMVRDECHAHHIIMDEKVFSYMHEFPETPQPKQMELFSQ